MSLESSTKVGMGCVWVLVYDSGSFRADYCNGIGRSRAVRNCRLQITASACGQVRQRSAHLPATPHPPRAGSQGFAVNGSPPTPGASCRLNELAIHDGWVTCRTVAPASSHEGSEATNSAERSSVDCRAALPRDDGEAVSRERSEHRVQPRVGGEEWGRWRWLLRCLESVTP
ncbi:hypothetical protein [Haladaptatus caseinilyticus]|uniref:hypothetical protein n=1 Tax=Haladaptatus caseinilyticus TaxID=2993314 RepID=UPI00224B44C9|nr:hypothetical protein [Haladaptatus caseinilyticus]